MIYRNTGDTGAELLFSATQNAVHELTSSERGHSPLTWAVPWVWAAGHRPGCRPGGRSTSNTAMRRTAAAWPATRPPTTAARWDRSPRLMVQSEDPPSARCSGTGSRERITDDCPRCGWHGYFHHYIATVDGDWAAAVCDDVPYSLCVLRITMLRALPAWALGIRAAVRHAA